MLADLAAPKFGFPPQSRLKKTDDFSSVFNFRKRVSGHYLAMHYLRKPDGIARLGLIVSKKIAKRSVDRNYMKRVLRELFRTRQGALGSLDLVIRTQRSFGYPDFVRIEQEFDELLARLPGRSAP